MIIDTPISLGELIDKISILQIKWNRIPARYNEKKLKLIRKECKLLQQTLKKSLSEENKIKYYFSTQNVI